MKDYKAPFEKIKKLVEKQNYDDAADLLEPFMEEIETAYQAKKGTAFSFNHILEVYEYEYFKKPLTPPEYTDLNISAFYRFYGFVLMHLNLFTEAIEAYEKALSWNPVDLDAILQLVELYKRTGELEKVKKYSFLCYDFCCTRATLARFYRGLGFYYLETQQPDIAIPLYIYSNIYYETKQANNELDFLEKALNAPLKQYSIQELQAVLKGNQIPIGPNPDTLGIAYRVGQLELESGNIDNARDCFTMVYDLTLDAQVKEILEKI